MTILAISLTACSSLTPQRAAPIINSGTVDLTVCKVPLDINRPNPMIWEHLRFYVLNKERMAGIIDGNDEELPEVFFALSARGYESLAVNILEIARIIESNKALLDNVEAYYGYDADISDDAKQVE